jgi:hypothetical protein
MQHRAAITTFAAVGSVLAYGRYEFAQRSLAAARSLRPIASAAFPKTVSCPGSVRPKRRLGCDQRARQITAIRQRALREDKRPLVTGGKAGNLLSQGQPFQNTPRLLATRQRTDLQPGDTNAGVVAALEGRAVRHLGDETENRGSHHDAFLTVIVAVGVMIHCRQRTSTAIRAPLRSTANRAPARPRRRSLPDIPHRHGASRRWRDRSTIPAPAASPPPRSRPRR